MRFIRILPVFFVRFELWIFTRFFYKDSLRILECILAHLLLPVFKRDLSEFFKNHCLKKADDLWILLDSLNNFMGILQFFGNIPWFICFCWSEKFFLVKIDENSFLKKGILLELGNLYENYWRISRKKSTRSIWKVRTYQNFLWIFVLKNADKFFNYFNQNTNLD